MLKVLTNQTLYQCEYCGKRLLSKNGAKLHETVWCRVVQETNREEKQKNCSHENKGEHWDYIPGEAVMQPEYLYCIDCGKIL